MSFLKKNNSIIRCLEENTLPIILSFPHSGRDYNNNSIQKSKLSKKEFRKSEDAFLDYLFAMVFNLNINYIYANFPRVFIDLNRHRNEIIMSELEGAPKDFKAYKTQLALNGFGLIHTVSSNGKRFYDNKITWKEYQNRLINYYDPWYHNFKSLIEKTKRCHDNILLIDCHSMPSSLGSSGFYDYDFVIGDLNGASCSDKINDFLEDYFKQYDFKISFNKPYSGQNILKNFTNPSIGIYGIQLEINKNIYMDENKLTYDKSNKDLEIFLKKLIEALGFYLRGFDRLANAAE